MAFAASQRKHVNKCEQPLKEIKAAWENKNNAGEKMSLKRCINKQRLINESSKKHQKNTGVHDVTKKEYRRYDTL
ncbi:hypothetical protein [Cronobacter dublinensis]|uniref:hypothetical protein n=1 Tax=Cronobacter dublinensis TaxID=413497 RepID=UPI0024C3838C|nr:hypothetical protein [Cronobacter dublinensis]MDK1254007.1 hypothetical protein [Cronobacter dublinensis]